MWKLTTILLCTVLLLGGCGNPGKVEFVRVVQNHRELTVETNTAVIQSIQDEMQELQDNGILTSDMQEACNSLIDRLQCIIDQSQVMEEYVNTVGVDAELLSKLLKARWEDGRSEKVNK